MTDNIFGDLSASDREVLGDLTFNAYYHRREIQDKLSHPKRDLYQDCGYPESSELSAAKFLDLYERFPIATRVIDLPVDESWRIQPVVFETKELEETEFEKAWNSLNQSLYSQVETNHHIGDHGSLVWEVCKRADKLSRIGSFGVLLLELSDIDGENVTYDKPAPGFSLSGEDSGGNATDITLVGLRCFDETHVDIVEWYTEGPLNGRPRMYSVTISETDNNTGEHHAIGVTTQDVQVHWTRIVHLADGLTNSEFVGTPALKPVVNEIMDLRKVFGASGEGYWRMAFPWLSFESHPNLGGKATIDKDALSEEVERAKNTLERYMATVGGSWKTIAGTVTDPKPHIDPRISAICVYLGCPVRIFNGSERGELASSTDKDSWDERMIMRQTSYITPKIIAPLVNRLITTGVLPVPSEGFGVRWPDLTTLSLQSKATWAVTQVNAITKYVQGGGDYLIAPAHFLTKVLGFSPQEAQEILNHTQEHIDEGVDDPEALIGRIPVPEPIDVDDAILKKRDSGKKQEAGLDEQQKVAGNE